MSTRDKEKNSQKRYSSLSDEEVGTLFFSDATLRLVTATLTPPQERGSVPVKRAQSDGRFVWGVEGRGAVTALF